MPILLVTVLLWVINFTQVLAQAEYQSAHTVTYQLENSGLATVSNQITLTNKMSDLYFSSYSYQIQTNQINEVTVFDNEGKLKFDQNNLHGWTNIKVYFSHPVVGLDKSMTFNLNYVSSDVAKKVGQIWEISIPKLTNASQVANYRLFLKIPRSLGEPSYIKPPPIEKTADEHNYIYRFDKNQISQTGVAAAIGDHQDYRFQLAYHLDNPYLSPGETEIALPMDTAYQKIFFSRIVPLPTQVRRDEDGNWLAKYWLKPKEKINIAVEGYARIFDHPQPYYLTVDAAKYLLEQKYWPVNNLQFKDTVPVLNSVGEIYGFVVNHLDYSYQRINSKVERQGAQQALLSPDQAICMEFTDLFITLARRRQIPAREINGYAFTSDSRLKPISLVSDVLHSWPEYFDEDKRTWIQVDPTWEKTTEGIDHFYHFDFNHLALAIHGLSSEYPLPAGSYKSNSSLGKDVIVDLATEELPSEKSLLAITFDIPSKIVIQNHNPYSIEINNLGPGAVYDLEMAIETSIDNRSINSQDYTLDLLLPYQSQIVQLNLPPHFSFNSVKGQITVRVNGQSFSHSYQTVNPVKAITLRFKAFFDKIIQGVFDFQPK